MKFNTQQNLQTLRKDIDNALAAVATKHGVSFELGRCRYAPDGSTCRFMGLDVSQAGAPNKLEQEWNDYCTLYDLKKVWLGKTFTFEGTKYTILGLDGRAKKFKVVCSAPGGRGTVSFPSSTVVSLMGRVK